MKKIEAEKIELSKAVKAAAKMQVLLYDGDEVHRSGLATLWSIINDESEVVVGVKEVGDQYLEIRRPAVSAKEKLAALNLMSRLIMHREQVAKASGLVRDSAVQNATKTIVNIGIYSELPLEERIKKIQAAVSDVPLVLPEESK